MRRVWFHGAWVTTAAAIAVLVGTGTIELSSQPTANLWVQAGAGVCARSATPVKYDDSADPDARCGSFNAAWQAAGQTANDVIRVKRAVYPAQKLLTRAQQPTCEERGANSTGVRFILEPDTQVASIAFGDETTTGTSTESVQCITMTTESGTWRSGNLAFAFADDVTIERNVCNQHWAAMQCALWKGQTDRTTIHDVDWCCVTDNKLMETIVFDSTADDDPMVEANANIHMSDSTFHDLRRTGSDVHTECGLMAGVPGWTLQRTHWYGCTVMNFNVGAFSDTADIPQSDFLWENNIFEAPTNFTETDKLGLPFFQGCNTPDWSAKPGWVVQYNVFETGWYSGVGTGCGDTGLTLRANVGPVVTCPGGTLTYNILTEACPGTGNQQVSAASLFSGANFTDIAGHDWTYPEGALQIDQGDPASYPPTDIAGATRPQGSTADAGPYEAG